ncbi:MAG: bacterioferritin [Halofilum sp. (in: g-proteobacteria)]|nr:bacterioferritin [Halofilum sp. (in: g-proteobacteria)]
MKGDPKVIEYLQKGLRSELTAINQYMLHSRMLEDWGYDKLAAYEGNEAMDEMRHADRFIKRILFLEGLPNLQDLDPLRIGENVKEILENDRAAEKDALDLYREAVDVCEKAQDYASRDLFSELIADEEGHYDFLDTQLDLIESVGLQNYLQSQTGGGGGGGE